MERKIRVSEIAVLKLRIKAKELIDQGYDPNLINLIVSKKRQKMKKQGWCKVFNDTLKSISKDKEITGEILRVFLQIVSRLDYENKIILSQIDIANELGINKVNVSQAIKKLVDKKILIKLEQKKRCFRYKLNIEYAWKGTTKNFNKEYDELKLKESLLKHNI